MGRCFSSKTEISLEIIIILEFELSNIVIERSGSEGLRLRDQFPKEKRYCRVFIQGRIMAIFKSPEEISTPENMNKVLKDIDNSINKKLSLDENGDLVFDGNIVCNDVRANKNSIYLGKTKLTSAHLSFATNEVKQRDLLRYTFMMG